MSEILVNTIKKADGTGGLTVPTGSGTVATLAGGTFTGDITMSGADLVMSGADLVVGSNSIFIGGTGSANELSDYEEGTWTPVVRDGAVDGTALTFTVGNASYTKIGNQVHISCYMTRNDSNNRTGRFYLTGLPFASKSGIGHIAGGCWFDNSGGDLRTFVYIGGGQQFFLMPKAGSSDSYVDNDELSNGRPFYMGAVYPVA